LGLDLAGVESRPTGFCRLDETFAQTTLLYSNDEILKRIRDTIPEIVAIDAPLSLPPGRKSLEERTNAHLRESDKELLRRHIKFFPVTLGPMRKLTERGINLKRILESESLRAIEVYPGGAQDVLGIPRKQRGLNNLKTGLEKLGIKGLEERLSDHELDAVTCAYVGKLFLEGQATIYGHSDDGIVMPAVDKRDSVKKSIRK
jgi:predicted nuclease with RNAse H fold